VGGAKDGVAQSQGARLPDIGAIHVLRRQRTHQGEQFLLAVGLQLALEFVGRVEVVLDGALVAPGDEDHVAHAGRVGLLHRVLDQGLVDHRQHFLR
jgi:hypothetical protein